MLPTTAQAELVCSLLPAKPSARFARAVAGEVRRAWLAGEARQPVSRATVEKVADVCRSVAAGIRPEQRLDAQSFASVVEALRVVSDQPGAGADRARIERDTAHGHDNEVEGWALELEDRAGFLRRDQPDDPKTMWLAARIEAFARYLREAWAHRQDDEDADARSVEDWPMADRERLAASLEAAVETLRAS